MRMTEAEWDDLMKKRASKPPACLPELTLSVRQGVVKGPNKTEAAYGNMLRMEFPVSQIIFEGIKLKMSNGHAYTPDFCVYPVDGKILLVEVKARGKDGYRQPSYQRAKLAFDQCRVEYSLFLFRWAEKHSGEWYVSGCR